MNDVKSPTPSRKVTLAMLGDKTIMQRDMKAYQQANGYEYEGLYTPR